MVSWPNRPRTVSETFDKRRTGERVGLLFLASFPNKRFRKSSLAFWVAKGLQFDLVREGRGSGGRGGVEEGRGRGAGSEWREGGSGGKGVRIGVEGRGEWREGRSGSEWKEGREWNKWEKTLHTERLQR